MKVAASPPVTCERCRRLKPYGDLRHNRTVALCTCPPLDYPDPVLCPTCGEAVRSPYDRAHVVNDLTPAGARKQVIVIARCKRMPA